MEKNGLLDNVWTVPNALTVLRILLIPVFVVLFYKEMFFWSFVTLFVSGLTDFLDGTIARKFNQISALGKLLDPVADKLTQIALAIVLFIEFRQATSPSMRGFSWVFLFFLAKEGVMIIGGALMLLKGIRPGAAEIYGKVATAAFYVIMLLIVAFGPEVGVFVRTGYTPAIPEWLTMTLVVIAAILTTIALLSYAPETIRQFKENNREKKAAKGE